MGNSHKLQNLEKQEALSTADGSPGLTSDLHTHAMAYTHPHPHPQIQAHAHIQKDKNTQMYRRGNSSTMVLSEKNVPGDFTYITYIHSFLSLKFVIVIFKNCI